MRESAALALAQYGEKAAPAIPDIKANLRKGSEETQLAMWVALGSAQGNCERYANELIGLLYHVEWYVRAFAAKKVGELGPSAVDALSRLRELEWDEEPAVREAATRAIELIDG